jgi:hypothetical protein
MVVQSKVKLAEGWCEMVMPLIGAAARMGAKKVAEKGVKKVPKRDNRDEDVRDAVGVALSAGSAAGATSMLLGQEDRIKKAEANKEQEAREAKAEMKREARGMKNGGAVSSASKRADGIAMKGKTKGRIV